jgi:uncharacterized protein (TIGR02598 family)
MEVTLDKSHFLMKIQRVMFVPPKIMTTSSAKTPALLSNRALIARLNGGFSLIEIILAVGIASASLLTIMSAVPTGLSNLHDAGRQIVETAIFNQIGNELACTPFSDTGAGHATPQDIDHYAGYRCPVYYDTQGLETTNTNAIYTVRCVVSGTGEIRQATVRIGFHKDPGTTDTAGLRATQRTFLLTNRTGY